MPNYEVDCSYDLTEYYTHVINGADSADEAENLTVRYISDTFSQAKNIEVDAVREVKV